MIREASVASGTEFLTHPSVIPHSKEEKASFLRGKGLTTEEIEEAFRRVESRQGGSAAPASAAPGVPQPQPANPAVVYAPAPIQPPPQQESQWSFVSMLAPISLALSAGASALYFYKTYVLHEGNQFPWESNSGGLQPPPLFQEPAGNMPSNPPGAVPSVANEQQQQQNQPQALPQPPLPGTSWSNYGLPGLGGNNPPNNANTTSSSNALVASPTNSLAQQSSFSNDQLRRSVEEQNSMIKEVMGSLKELATTLKEKKSEESSNNGLNLQTVLQAMQASGEVKAELSAIKTLLLATLVNKSAVGTSSASVPGENQPDISQLIAALSSPEKQANTTNLLQQALSPTKAEAEAEEPPKPVELTQEEIDEKKRIEGIEKARAALGELVKQCPAENDELLSAGCGMMLMFLKNILKDPLNPRYRRVARTNANFKKNLEPLVGYVQVFEALGFDERGMQLELKSEWVESLEKDTPEVSGWAKAIIEDAITNLESVREQRSPYAATPAPSSTVSSPAKPKIAKWEPPPQASLRQDPIQNPVPPPPPKVQSSPAAADAPAGPSYPLTLAEVAKMHAEGKRPEGIKDIPDKLSTDEPSKSTMTPPPKPWEKAASVPGTSSPSPHAEHTSSRLYQLGEMGRSRVEIVELNDDGSENGNNKSTESPVGSDQEHD